MKGKFKKARQAKELRERNARVAATPCPRCGHHRDRHPGGVCAVTLNELPSCVDCSAGLRELLSKPVAS